MPNGMRSFEEMLGDTGAPSISAGVRATPGFEPTPNSEPTGSLTGAPPRSRAFQARVIPNSAVGVRRATPTQLAPATRENRIVNILAPAVGFTVYIGEAGVTPGTGFPVPPGVPYDYLLVGNQELFAVTDAPVYLQVGVQISSVLLADRERKL